MSKDDLWFKVFTVYQKDPNLLDKWVEMITSDPIKALEIARRYVVDEIRPNALTLGFSPQVLVAILSINYPKPVIVVTSPEVLHGVIPAAKHSYLILNIYREKGLIGEIYEVPMAPTKEYPPSKVVLDAYNILSKLDVEVIDISGGTQLIAIAATRTGKKLSYTYPLGDRVKIYAL